MNLMEFLNTIASTGVVIMGIDLAEEILARPKSRITIPEGHLALILPAGVVHDVKQLCLFIRRGGKRKDVDALHSIAGDLLLAVVEAEDRNG
jgi:hypothetical protein